MSCTAYSSRMLKKKLYPYFFQLWSCTSYPWKTVGHGGESSVSTALSILLSKAFQEVWNISCMNDCCFLSLQCRVPIMLVGNKNDLHMERYVLKHTKLYIRFDICHTWVKPLPSFNHHFCIIHHPFAGSCWQKCKTPQDLHMKQKYRADVNICTKLVCLNLTLCVCVALQLHIT